jgi:hypothetical protein
VGLAILIRTRQSSSGFIGDPSVPLKLMLNTLPAASASNPVAPGVKPEFDNRAPLVDAAPVEPNGGLLPYNEFWLEPSPAKLEVLYDIFYLF